MKVVFAQNMIHVPTHGGANKANRVLAELLAAARTGFDPLTKVACCAPGTTAQRCGVPADATSPETTSPCRTS